MISGLVSLDWYFFWLWVTYSYLFAQVTVLVWMDGHCELSYWVIGLFVFLFLSAGLFFFLSWQVGELLADLIEPFKICFSILGSGSVLAFSLGTEMLCHVVRLKHWVINEISACWLVRFWTQSSRSSGNRSSFMVFTKPMEFQCTHTQDSATNSRGCSAFLTLFFF